jgi:hypothetical protein
MRTKLKDKTMSLLPGVELVPPAAVDETLFSESGEGQALLEVAEKLVSESRGLRVRSSASFDSGAASLNIIHGMIVHLEGRKKAITNPLSQEIARVRADFGKLVGILSEVKDSLISKLSLWATVRDEASSPHVSVRPQVDIEVVDIDLVPERFLKPREVDLVLVSKAVAAGEAFTIKGDGLRVTHSRKVVPRG